MDELKRILLTPLLVGVHAAWVVANTAGRIRLSNRLDVDSSRSRWLKIPRHVAVVLVLPNSDRLVDEATFHVRQAQSRKGKGRAQDEVECEIERQLLMCLKDVVEWASEVGISELSLWNEQGLLQKYETEILRMLNPHPSSPPSSGASSPPPIIAAASSSSSSSSSWSEEKLRSRNDSYHSGIDHMDEIESSGGAEVLTISVWPDLGDVLLKSSSGSSSTRTFPNPLTVHLLSTSASYPLFNRIAIELADRKDFIVKDITQDVVDGMISDRLHFSVDPDLLIIHDMQPQPQPQPQRRPSSRRRGHQHDGKGDEMMVVHSSSPSIYKQTLQAILPEQPPELHGYPFWNLRITEIYRRQPPPLQPLYVNRLLPGLGTPKSLWRFKSDDDEPDIGTALLLADKQRRINHASWDDAVRRWSGVEQRLGR